jgi:hypothetical protein
MGGEHLSVSYRARLRAYRYGTARSRSITRWPTPYRGVRPRAQSATVHLGGTYEKMARSEADTARGASVTRHSW